MILNFKAQAAREALSFVESGMVLGLGTGSTTGFFLKFLAERLESGGLRNIQGVPTSRATAVISIELGIPLTTLKDHPILDLAIDGADEVDDSLNLIKGLGRALLREKIVEINADRFIVVVEESKLVPRLGTTVPLPVEIVQFEAESHVRWLNSLGCRAELWMEEDRDPVVTDNGNYLVRCWFDGDFGQGIDDPYTLAQELITRPGIVEHGLFMDMADQVILAGENGIHVLQRNQLF